MTLAAVSAVSAGSAVDPAPGPNRTSAGRSPADRRDRRAPPRRAWPTAAGAPAPGRARRRRSRASARRHDHGRDASLSPQVAHMGHISEQTRGFGVAGRADEDHLPVLPGDTLQERAQGLLELLRPTQERQAGPAPIAGQGPVRRLGLGAPPTTAERGPTPGGSIRRGVAGTLGTAAGLATARRALRQPATSPRPGPTPG